MIYKAGKAKKIFFTGGINPYDKTLPPEGDIHIKRAKRMGLKNEDFLLRLKLIILFKKLKQKIDKK